MTRRRLGRFARRFVGVVLGGAGLLLSLAVLGYFAFYGLAAMVSNPRYAEQVFAGLLPYDDVLASKKWHAIGDEPRACTYAIVSLPSDAGIDPPTGKQADWRLVFAGDWKPTPERSIDGAARDPATVCSDEWSEETGQRLIHALEKPGSWYWRDDDRETVYIYSQPEHLAARIRWGE